MPFLVLLAGLALYCVFVYNRLVALRQSGVQAFSDIDVQLKMRADLVPNLVSTVKGYASHESETLEAVMRARAATQVAGSPSAAAAADGLMTAALGRLLAVAEAYPDLKASANFSQLQADLSDIENKIAAARRFLNSSVAEYNAAIEQFPAVLVARSLGFTAQKMFEISAENREAAERAPTVSF